MKKTTARRLHFAAVLLSPPLRITFYVSLLGGLAAAGVKAAGNAAQRRSFACSFSPFSLFICYAQLAVAGKLDKSNKNEKSSCCVKACRASLMTIYISLESFFLPWVLTQNTGKGGISPYMAIPSALFTNLLMVRSYQKARTWLYTRTQNPEETMATQTVTSSNTETLLPETNEGQPSTSEGSEASETSEIEIVVLNLPSRQTSHYSALAFDL